MQVKTLKNISRIQLNVELSGGGTVFLPPTGTVENVDVKNLDQLSGKVHVVENLTEVSDMGAGATPKRQYLKS